MRLPGDITNNLRKPLQHNLTEMLTIPLCIIEFSSLL